MAGHRAAEELRGVEGLPPRKVVAKDDGDLLGRCGNVGHG